MFACPACKSALDPNAPYCRSCALAVRFEAGRVIPIYPSVQPGEVVMSHDLAQSRPHGMKNEDFVIKDMCRVTRRPEGVELAVEAGKAYECSFLFARRRDACVRASFVALDPSAIFQLVLRRESLGDAAFQYALSAWPGRRQMRLVRSVTSAIKSVALPLVDWQSVPALLPPGQLNDVEFRAFGSTLEGLLQGQRVLIFHDPVLGIGMPGVRVEALESPGRCTWRGIEVRAVA